ncbi:hypothetical protein FNV62_36375 [Streptomyces sp. RLB3-17]|uniref:hypothetical protein n=1 Tax=Streptomyces sp. RLB3-17 TaxID=2594455 RepID=UPI001164C454|nr:hypothetical protein [Streptomyces sp. RLB3-17]QDO42887.1 hypothetical protein FNV62_36375 [Streptomyces sp. RLB3-17]
MTLDVGLQIHALLDLAEISTDVRALKAAVRRNRDSDLLARLENSVPPEKLKGAATDQGVDLDRLEQQFPYVRIMYIMSTASTMEDVACDIEGASRDRAE